MRRATDATNKLQECASASTTFGGRASGGCEQTAERPPSSRSSRVQAMRASAAIVLSRRAAVSVAIFAIEPGGTGVSSQSR